jgi:hypothetical protein
LFIMIPSRYLSSIMGKKNVLPFSMAYWWTHSQSSSISHKLDMHWTFEQNWMSWDLCFLISFIKIDSIPFCIACLARYCNLQAFHSIINYFIELLVQLIAIFPSKVWSVLMLKCLLRLLWLKLQYLVFHLVT